MNKDQTRVVEQRWGNESFNAQLRDIYWMASPIVREYVNQGATGDRATDWLTWFDRKVLRSAPSPIDCLVLGCGEGWLERTLATSSAVRRIDAFDISSEAVATADQLAKQLQLPIRYGVLNLDCDHLERSAYDVVIAHSVLHHIAELEHAYDEIHASLRPGGLLLLYEYVGPDRLQYTDRQLDLINQIMVRLPERLRRSHTQQEILPHHVRPSLTHLNQIDPSEAVRSSEVLPRAGALFEELIRRDTGGTILHHLLYDLVQNFVPGDEHDDAVIRLICALEEELIQAGGLPSDFVITISKRKIDSTVKFEVPPVPHVPEPSALDVEKPLCWLFRRRRRSSMAGGEASVFLGESAVVREHLHRRATGDPNCDAPTLAFSRIGAQWSTEMSRARVRILEECWLAPILRTRFARVEVGPEKQGEDVDAIFSVGSLGSSLCNHKRMSRLHQSLAPGGALVTLERLPIGGAFLRTVSRISQNLLALLPSRFDRQMHIESATSPTISPENVENTVAEYFRIDTFRPIGWALLQRVLPLITSGVDENDEMDQTLVRLLCLLDGEFTDSRVIPSEFVFLIAFR